MGSVPTPFITHFQGHPQYGAACTQLLQRVENHEIQGFTSIHVLGETTHRLMTIEAHQAWGWPFVGIGNRLRTNPLEVKKLAVFRSSIEKVFQGSIRVLGIDPAVFRAGLPFCQQFGLLTNDALTTAVMHANGLGKIASEDDDFDRVPGITRYAPV